MNEITNFLKDLERDLQKDFILSLDYQELAKNIYPYLLNLHKNNPTNFIQNHISQLKKTIKE